MLLVSLHAAGNVQADSDTALPQSIARLLDADPAPAATLDPSGRYLLEVHRHGLLSSRSLSQPMLTVAGLPINPLTYSRHAPLPYFGFTLTEIASGTGIEVSLPRNDTIGFPAWSPDGARYAFTVTTMNGVELWIGTADHRPPRKLIGPVLNATRSTPCEWMPDSTSVLCRVTVHGSASSDAPRHALSEATHTGGRFSPRRDQDAEDRLVAHYLTSQLELIDVASGERSTIGEPAVFEAVEPSPNGRYLLVSRAVPPYSRHLARDPIPRAVEIWDRGGTAIHRLVIETRDGSAGPPRAPSWHPSRPSTVVWVEPKAGGDRVMANSLPFEGPPRTLFATPENRFSGITWLADSDLGLLSEYDGAARLTRVWLIDSTAGVEPRLLGNRGADSALPNIGRPIATRNAAGKPVARVRGNRILLKGQEPAAQGTRSYVEALDLDSLDTHRLWESDATGHERVIDVLPAAGDRLLTQYQSAEDPPNYRVHDVSADTWRPLTRHTHPAAQLRDARRQHLSYQRSDGVRLSSTLYVPAEREPGARLPLILWAYPREYRNGDVTAAHSAPDRFLDVDRGFKLFFLLRGYAVLDDVSMPVVGEAREANDTFVEQIAANAAAAIEAAAETGIVDPGRVGVAGHSYGAFMVANLLAHTRLFRAGAALSGAYNRTLTPFGFQTERRTLWEARDTYLQMSPFFFSDQIEAPLLLVHGLRDDNAGTSPMQSQYFYEAIRRHGGVADLLLLPLEGHAYRGRDSVLQTAHAMLRWFDSHVMQPDELPLEPYIVTDRRIEVRGALPP